MIPFQIVVHAKALEKNTVKTHESAAQLLETGGRVALCDFQNYNKNGETRVWDQCLLEAQEGYAYNIYICKVLFKLINSFLLQS